MGIRSRNDAEGVYVWVCRLKGTHQTTAAYADRGAARAWVQGTLGNGGTWNESEYKDRYDCEADTGIIELVPVTDADALIMVDPPAATE